MSAERLRVPLVGRRGDGRGLRCAECGATMHPYWRRRWVREQRDGRMLCDRCEPPAGAVPVPAR